ncbi:hypothetical protein Pelo_11150 [Pelomyxa schiedti]|nr:hypothetical protein Pelo_11150 [Pelomyxa schiedti]
MDFEATCDSDTGIPLYEFIQLSSSVVLLNTFTFLHMQEKVSTILCSPDLHVVPMHLGILTSSMQSAKERVTEYRNDVGNTVGKNLLGIRSTVGSVIPTPTQVAELATFLIAEKNLFSKAKQELETFNMDILGSHYFCAGFQKRNPPQFGLLSSKEESADIS